MIFLENSSQNARNVALETLNRVVEAEYFYLNIQGRINAHLTGGVHISLGWCIGALPLPKGGAHPPAPPRKSAPVNIQTLFNIPTFNISEIPAVCENIHSNSVSNIHILTINIHIPTLNIHVPIRIQPSFELNIPFPT